MRLKSAQLEWLRLGLFVKGASHAGAGTPMQDSIRGWPKGIGPATLSTLVLSDGHGNKKHFRSAIGAQLITLILVEVLVSWAKKLKDTRLTGGILDAVSKKIASAVLDTWVERVTQHARCEPFPQRNLEILSKKSVSF